MKCFFLICLLPLFVSAQDTTVVDDYRVVTLPEVFIRNNFDYKKLIQQIKEDTTFYKAFRNLRILGYTSYNDIQILDKKNRIKASLSSKTIQHRADSCRTTEIIEETTIGDFYKNNHEYNYLTAELYASLFFSKGKVCGENNIVKGKLIDPSNKSGMEKHKEQLKMLFFNPGQKIPGIPFIGNKLDLYDERAQKYYDYKIDIVEFQQKNCYTFTIKPKDNLGWFKDKGLVVDEMITWFDIKTLEVLARNYKLSYRAGVYDFDVTMEVIMDKFNGLTVPKTLRYKGNWRFLFKKRENAVFTATLFDFKEGTNSLH
ncbi:MAG: hypothetical protein KGZ59_12305 [Chitinophagaceae bacterium]|nr:hypothetical protein [Chitinophagaceae bacterium]